MGLLAKPQRAAPEPDAEVRTEDIQGSGRAGLGGASPIQCRLKEEDWVGICLLWAARYRKDIVRARLRQGAQLPLRRASAALQLVHLLHRTQCWQEQELDGDWACRQH